AREALAPVAVAERGRVVVAEGAGEEQVGIERETLRARGAVGFGGGVEGARLSLARGRSPDSAHGVRATPSPRAARRSGSGGVRSAWSQRSTKSPNGRPSVSSQPGTPGSRAASTRR